jgi:predicted Zn-dependent protease
MLQIMGKHLQPGGLDFAKTHPAPESRIENIKGLIAGDAVQAPSAAQQRRFDAAMKGV